METYNLGKIETLKEFNSLIEIVDRDMVRDLEETYGGMTTWLNQKFAPMPFNKEGFRYPKLNEIKYINSINELKAEHSRDSRDLDRHYYYKEDGFTRVAEFRGETLRFKGQPFFLIDQPSLFQ
jgi:hypothetical protein